MRVLRTIDKVGGLDEYLLGDKPMRIKELGPWGWKLRWRIMQSEVIFERFAMERVKLGLVPQTRSQFEEETLREFQSAEADSITGAPLKVVTRDDMIAETDRMIASQEDFPLGEESNLAGSEIAKDEGFMKEARP